MVKSLCKSIIGMYLMGACAVLGMSNQNALSEDLESYPLLNSALQKFTCELYYRFGSFLAPLSVGLITSRHYFTAHGIKNGDDTSDKGTASNSDQVRRCWVCYGCRSNDWFSGLALESF